MTPFDLDFIAAYPFLVLAAGTVMVLLLDLFKIVASRILLSLTAAVSCILAIVAFAPYWFAVETAFHGQLAVDAYGMVLSAIILLGTAAVVVLNARTLEAQGVRAGVDIDVLVLLSAAGALVMVTALNLIVLFLGFELLSVAVYVLTGAAKGERASSEGAVKYFLFGAFSSAFLLYGMVLVYAASGSMALPEIATAAAAGGAVNPLLLAGLVLIVLGFAFKTSLVPFHFWAPDVYQGAPVSLVVYLSVVVKVAAFGALLRILSSSFGAYSDVATGMVVMLAVLTMTVANFVALRQQSMKRMLSYSSIAHAGYICLGLLSGGTGGGEAVIFYLAVYSLMTIAAFSVVLLVTAGSDEQYARDDIASYRGLGWKHPLLGFGFCLALLSLAGLPPLGGFFGKFYLFAAAVRSGYTLLVVLAAVNSVVSLYYYLRVLVVLYMTDGECRVRLRASSLGSQFVLAAAVLCLVGVGLFSAPALKIAKTAVSSLQLGAAPNVAVYNPRSR